MEITRRHITTALTLLVVMIAAILLDRWIVTGKERISNAVEGMTDACRNGDAQALFSHVSPRYNDGTLNYISLRALAETYFKVYGPTNVKTRLTVVGIKDRESTADVTVFARSSDGTLIGSSQWRMDFEKDANDEWKLVALTPVEINQQRVGGWGEVISLGNLR